MSDPEGTISMDTENLQNGDYWLKEVKASYGQDVLTDPIPFSVSNPERTQMKRVLAAPGEVVVLGAYSETRVNGHAINTVYTSGRTADAVPDSRRVIVAKDKYFVQGDQLSLSVDSRDADYGTVSDEDVLGRAEFVIWQLRCFGSLTGTRTAASSAWTSSRTRAASPRSGRSWTGRTSALHKRTFATAKRFALSLRRKSPTP